jgi:hypothetical protein
MDIETGVLFHILSVYDSSYFSSSDTLSHNLGMDNVQEYFHNVELTGHVMMLIPGSYLLPDEYRQRHLMVLHLHQMWVDGCPNL